MQRRPFFQVKSLGRFAMFDIETKNTDYAAAGPWLAAAGRKATLHRQGDRKVTPATNGKVFAT